MAPTETAVSQAHRLGAAFLFHFLVMMAVLSLTLGIVAHTYFEYVQRPRLSMITDVYTANLAGLAEAVQALPPPMRHSYVDSLERFGNGMVAADDPGRWGLSPPPPGLVDEFFRELSEKLPAYSLGWTKGTRPLLWVALPIHPGEKRWVRIDMPPFVFVPLGKFTAALLLVVITASAGSAYLIVRTRRRLAWVARALDSMDPRSAHAIEQLPAQENEDLLDVDRHFRQMAARVSEAQGERALLMAGVSRDLGPLLERMRELQSRASTPAEVTRCIDEMDRAIGQFSLFAQPADAEPNQALDLNELLGALVMEYAGGGKAVATQLAALPPVDLTPSAAHRIFGNLLDNALRYGSQVEVTGSLEENWVVARVLDRGPGVAAHELALLGRPLYRTEAARERSTGCGLGLAIARHDVAAHGGMLRLANRAGGGLQADVRLRPGRPGPAAAHHEAGRAGEGS